MLYWSYVSFALSHWIVFNSIQQKFSPNWSQTSLQIHCVLHGCHFHPDRFELMAAVMLPMEHPWCILWRFYEDRLVCNTYIESIITTFMCLFPFRWGLCIYFHGYKLLRWVKLNQLYLATHAAKHYRCLAIIFCILFENKKDSLESLNHLILMMILICCMLLSIIMQAHYPRPVICRNIQKKNGCISASMNCISD